MESISHDMLILFMIIFGASTWVLSWAIKRLRSKLYKVECEVSKMDRKLMREEKLTKQLTETLREHNVKFDEVDVILNEMRGIHDSS